MNQRLRVLKDREVEAENKLAAIFSIMLPGLGQIYKGHFAAGLLWIFVGMPLALWVGILLSLATAGLGLVVPLGCWAALVVDAYYEKDRRHHHPLPPVDWVFAVEQD